MADEVLEAGISSLPSLEGGSLGTGNGVNYNFPVEIFSGGSEWTAVAAGGSSSAGIGYLDGPSVFSVKNMWGWGQNSYGQLGDDKSDIDPLCPRVTVDNILDYKQVSCGFDFTTAVTKTGFLWIWGDNTYGQLGNLVANHLQFKHLWVVMTGLLLLLVGDLF